MFYTFKNVLNIIFLERIIKICEILCHFTKTKTAINRIARKPSFKIIKKLCIANSSQKQFITLYVVMEVHDP